MTNEFFFDGFNVFCIGEGAVASVNLLKDLKTLRGFNGGQHVTVGLTNEQVAQHAALDTRLVEVVQMAVRNQKALQEDFADVLKLDERKQIETLQEGIVNFYGPQAVNPYVPLAALGPWIVSTCGAVIFDSGGYGMLGKGHNPADVIDAMAKPQVMANVMTASFLHRKFITALRKEVGHARRGAQADPFKGFVCLNSGSESVTLCLRITDTNAYTLTAPGARHAGKPSKFLAFNQGFHGRTDRPASVSDSCLANYKKHLASFRDVDNLITISPNDISALEQVFARADKENFFVEALLFEPVMGEGNPGLALTAEFYKKARELSVAHGSLLIIDSIQAGLRTTGCLSVVDYPGFQELDPPDMETYSKALNAGQYPLSVVAFGPRAVNLYAHGTYGNTMTTNPRALAVANQVLGTLTADLRKNIVDRGNEAVKKFALLSKEFPDVIEGVQGTGLLFSVAVNPKVFKVVGAGGLEEYLRTQGCGVIHGSANSLRYTPPFDVTSEQIDLLVSVLRDAIAHAPHGSKEADEALVDR